MGSEEYAVATHQVLQAALEHYGAGRLSEAESICWQVLYEEPGHADAYHLLGVIAHQVGKDQLAVELIRTAIGLQPTNAVFQSNLGEIYLRLGRLGEAEPLLRRALELKPDLADAHNNLANLLRASARGEAAEQSYRRAIELAPPHALARLNLSLLQLLRGNYAEGFSLYESRFDEPNLSKKKPTQSVLKQIEDVPRWQGENIGGRSLLLWTEQGFGDTLMMMRYVPLLKERGIGHLVVYCEPALVRVMQTFPDVDEVISGILLEPQGAIHCHCPIMSLPLLFETRIESIPGETPYLHVPDQLNQKWAGTFAEIQRPRIGLVWATGTDANRDIALQSFYPVLECVKATLVSLQKGEKAKQLEEFDGEILDWMDRCDDFLETAALIEQLDLVISVDTAVAHLAGALGKPVWLLNRFESEWRWLLNREDSPWYPTMRIFYRSERGNWDQVIRQVTVELRAQFQSKRAPMKSKLLRWAKRFISGQTN